MSYDSATHLGRFIRRLTLRQWLIMAAIVSTMLIVYQYNITRFVKFSSPIDTFVSCDSLRDRCEVSLDSVPFSVSRDVDNEYLRALEYRIMNYHFNRSGFSMVHNHGCKSAFRTAVIVPYRNRSEHLQLFLQHMHRFLPRQQIDYAIYVVEQSDQLGFNRGKLFNVGFREASRDHDYCCFIFHDVDLLPQNLGNIYACSEQPRHLCVAIDVFGYAVPYADIFGGVVAMQKQHFEKVNGFSNRYFGWGAEDDDLAVRIKLAGLEIQRWPMDISKYSMLSHSKATPNPSRFDLLAETKSLWRHDGLNSLKYKLLAVDRKPLYTKISVDFNS